MMPFMPLVLHFDAVLVLHAQVTYMLEGSFSHEDFCGHRGTINPGDLQVSKVFMYSCNQ